MRRKVFAALTLFMIMLLVGCGDTTSGGITTSRKPESVEKVQDSILNIVPNTCSAMVVDNSTASYGLSLNGSEISSDQFYEIMDFCKEHYIEKVWGYFNYPNGKISFKWNVSDSDAEFIFQGDDKEKKEVSERSALRFLDGHAIYYYSDDLAIFLETEDYYYTLSDDKKSLTLMDKGNEWPQHFTWEYAEKIMELDPNIDTVTLSLPKKNMSIPFYRKGTEPQDSSRPLDESVANVFTAISEYQNGNQVSFDDEDLWAVYGSWNELQTNPIAGQPIEIYAESDKIVFVYGDGIILNWNYNAHEVQISKRETNDSSWSPSELDQALFDDVNYALSNGKTTNCNMSQEQLKELYEKIADGSFFDASYFSYVTEYGRDRYNYDISYDGLTVTVYHDTIDDTYGFDISTESVPN